MSIFSKCEKVKKRAFFSKVALFRVFAERPRFPTMWGTRKSEKSEKSEKS
jgi:hypothetical protein